MIEARVRMVLQEETPTASRRADEMKAKARSAIEMMIESPRERTGISKMVLKIDVATAMTIGTGMDRLGDIAVNLQSEETVRDEMMITTSMTEKKRTGTGDEMTIEVTGIPRSHTEVLEIDVGLGDYNINEMGHFSSESASR